MDSKAYNDTIEVEEDCIEISSCTSPKAEEGDVAKNNDDAKVLNGNASPAASRPAATVVVKDQESVVDSPVSIYTIDDRRRSSTFSKKKQSRSSARCCTTRFLIAAILCCIAILVIVVTVLWYTLIEKDEDLLLDPAVCGSCHCILESGDDAIDNSAQICPKRPRTNWTQNELNTLQSQQALNPLALKNTCNPFLLPVGEGNETYSCELDIKQPSSGVCGLHYVDCPSNNGYLMETYSDIETAESNGAFVTHTGPCGACSTTQDLSVFLRFPDWTSLSGDCVRQAATNQLFSTSTIGINRNVDIAETKSFKDGVGCFVALGLTQACAEVHTFAAVNTAQYCGGRCLLADVTDEDYFGPAPNCTLSTCLQCTEEFTGPVLQQYAGRTYANSGALSSLARQCNSIADIDHVTCPVTTNIFMSMTGEETNNTAN